MKIVDVAKFTSSPGLSTEGESCSQAASVHIWWTSDPGETEKTVGVAVRIEGSIVSACAPTADTIYAVFIWGMEYVHIYGGYKSPTMSSSG